MRKIVILILFIVFMSSCEKLGIHLFKPSYDKTQFIRMTVVRGDDEFELEGYRKLAGMGGVNYDPWIAQQISKGIETSRRHYFSFYFYSGHNKKSESFLYGFRINKFVLSIPDGWTIGEKYSLSDDNSNYDFGFYYENYQDVILDFYYDISNKYTSSGEPNCYEIRYRITSCEIETIQPSGNKDDYYAVQFRLSAINEDGEVISIYGTAQNKKEVVYIYGTEQNRNQ